MGLGVCLDYFFQHKKQSRVFLLLFKNKRKNKGYGLVSNAVVLLNNESSLTLESELSNQERQAMGKVGFVLLRKTILVLQLKISFLFCWCTILFLCKTSWFGFLHILSKRDCDAHYPGALPQGKKLFCIKLAACTWNPHSTGKHWSLWARAKWISLIQSGRWFIILYTTRKGSRAL